MPKPPLIGEKAPLFPLEDAEGTLINPADALGKYVVIYFYPKALTSGCTVQACDLRDHWGDIQKEGIVVFGISPDAPKLLKKFKDSHSLPFTLLSDPDHRMALAYDVWKEKSMYGRTYMGIMRDTYVLNPAGLVIGVLHKVNPKTHFDEVISLVRYNKSQNT